LSGEILRCLTVTTVARPGGCKYTIKMVRNPTDWSNKKYWQNRFDIGDTPWELGTASSVLREGILELGSLFNMNV
jgi:hypothetical protein